MGNKVKYIGVRELTLTDEELAEFYSGDYPIELFENQYLMIRDKNGKVVDKRFFRDGTLEEVRFKTFDSAYLGKVKPRNEYQELAFHMFSDRRVPVKLFTSVYGGGKDFIMSAAAAHLLEKGAFEKMIYIRPNVSLGGVPDIGYLKGSEAEKLNWTLAPLWDKFGGKEAVERMCEEGKIELVALPFIRGRSFENSLIYVSEGQNITREIAGVIFGRVGENCELWINGDCHSQTDKRLYDDNNGIKAIIETLSGNELFEAVYSPITERSEVAKLAGLIVGD